MVRTALITSAGQRHDDLFGTGITGSAAQLAKLFNDQEASAPIPVGGYTTLHETRFPREPLPVHQTGLIISVPVRVVKHR